MNAKDNNPVSSSPPRLRALILEDDSRDAKLCAEQLRQGGYNLQFEIVDSPESFKECLAHAEFDVIIADYNLRTWTAIDALGILKQSGKDIPLIVSTGSLGDEPAVECIKQGAADFVLKDRPAHLAIAVNRALEDKQLREERHQALAALRESEKQYRVLFRDNPHPMWVYDLETLRFLEVNDSAVQHYGYSREEFLRMAIKDIRPPEDVPALLKNIAEVQPGVDRAATWRHRKKDGGIIDVEVTRHPTVFASRRAEVVLAHDVTDRKRAEEAVQESEDRYRDLVEHSSDLICTHDLEGRILSVNEPPARSLGCTRGEILGKNMRDILAPEFRDQFEAYLAEIQAKGVAQGLMSVITTSGEKRVWEYHNTLRTEGVAAPIVRGVAHDVTERLRAEKALRVSEAQNRLLADLLEGADQPFAVGYLDGRIGPANAAYERLTGYSREELERSDWAKVLTPPEWQEVEQRELEILRRTSKPVRYEKEYIRKDGTRVPIELIVHFRKGEGENPPIYYAFITDLTKRKQAEAELARLMTAIEQSAEAVVITDTGGNIQYVNPAFTRITGYSRGEARGENPRILKSDVQAPEFYEQMWQTIRRGEVWHGELVNRRKDGSLYTEEMNIAPVRDSTGEITHFIATKQDITERKELEQQFRQAQKMEAVGRLAGGVAHDFNNLLTIINGYSQLLLEKLDPGSPLSAQVSEIKKSGERAAELTQQLLAFSRRQVLTPQVLDLNQVVKDTDKMLRRLIGEDIECQTLLHPQLWRVRADPGQMAQIIMNLGVNARDAMPQGGTLTIETSNMEVSEAFLSAHAEILPGRYVVLAVRDTGMGMDHETQTHIFEPFFTTKEQGKGTGLGLATIYGIVKQSGGYIWLYSEPGRGATFKIYLPCVEGEVQIEAPSGERRKTYQGTETILLVEDDASVRHLVENVLKSQGYNILAAADPEEATKVSSAHEKTIDLLLTDLVMPKWNGRQLAEHLTFSRPTMKVMFMSGYTGDAVLRHGVLNTGAAFLQKPFTPQALIRKVRGVLDAPS